MKKNILLIFLSFSIWGCINYEQEIFLRSDGSGSATIHYWTDLEEIFKDTSSTNKFSFQESLIRKNFELKGVEIESINIWQKVEDTTFHAQIKIYFEDINDLSKTMFFRDDSISWKDGTLGQKIFTQKVNAFGSNQQIFDNYTLRFIYHFPGTVVFDNAKEKTNNKLIWYFKLSELNSGKTLSATIKLPEKSNISSIIITGLIIILISLWVFIFIKKRKRVDEEL